MTVRVEGLGSAVPTTAPAELLGISLVVARLIWGVLIAQALVLYAVSVPARYSQLSHPPADVRAQLAHVGLSADIYAAYLTVVGGIFTLVCCTVAALIIWHRPNDRIGLLASLYLALIGLTSPPEMQAVVTGYPALALPANLALFLYIILLVAFFFVFPDGRFVPRWSRIPLLVCTAGFTLIFFLTGASVVENPPDWTGLMVAGGAAAGIAAQIYRYVRVSDPLQRQQTKWVVLGVTGALATSIVFAFAGPLFPTIGRPETGYDLTSATTITLAYLFIPVTLGLAILRYRLWDIDVVINRALVYGVLTIGLAGLYLVVVGGLQALFQARGHLPSSLLATALIAVLFAPLRGRLQTAVNRLMYGERDDPYRVLTRLGERVGAALAPEAVLPAIAETVANAMKSPHVAIALQQAGTFTPAASRGVFDGAPLRVPLEYQGETVGELLVAPRSPGEEFSPADQRLLGDLARQIGPAARAVCLAADLQRSRERLVTAREEERRRLRRDLHDGLGPQLGALTLKIETIRNRFANDRDLDAALIDLTERTQAALSDIRRLIYGLRPPALDELGLLAAIGQAAEQYGQQGDGSLHVTVDAPQSLPPLPAAVEVAAYRIVQEALANVVRHSAACAGQVSVALDEERNVLRVQIVDDGHGLPDQHHAGVGLVSMRERAEELSGSCSIASPPSGGTMVTVELPCPPAHHQEMTISSSEER
jgi:signal transduction histidine kinase